MNKKITLLISSFFLSLTIFGQSYFQGTAGIFVLGIVNLPMPVSEYEKEFVSGTAVRTTWNTLETSPNIFDWTFLDNEINNATTHGKKISISVLGYPDWLGDENVPLYNYIDNKPTSPTFGDTLQSPITWSDEYVTRLENLIQNLADKYSNDTTVAYINAYAGRMNNNLPTTVASGQDFWTATNYHRDTLVTKMNRLTDFYMSVFPNTPAFNSLENIPFEIPASGFPNNYVITEFANYGATNYPERFGVWREDLSSCTATTNANGHWALLNNHPCRTGAQMVWNVQDGPIRMNQCGNLPNTKQHVLTLAIEKGFSMNMRYFEIYKVDIDDSSLATTLQTMHDSIMVRVQNCQPLATNTKEVSLENNLSFYPNPTYDKVYVESQEATLVPLSIQVYNALGQRVLMKSATGAITEIDLVGFETGMYFLVVEREGKVISYKVVKN